MTVPFQICYECGNGILEAGETCDDSNIDNLDGCSAECQIEPGFICSMTPSKCDPICGDGIVVKGEVCDEGQIFDVKGCKDDCSGSK